MEFVFASLHLTLACLTVTPGCKLVCSLWLVHINFVHKLGADSASELDCAMEYVIYGFQPILPPPPSKNIHPCLTFPFENCCFGFDAFAVCGIADISMNKNVNTKTRSRTLQALVHHLFVMSSDLMGAK